MAFSPENYNIPGNKTLQKRDVSLPSSPWLKSKYISLFYACCCSFLLSYRFCHCLSCCVRICLRYSLTLALSLSAKVLRAEQFEAVVHHCFVVIFGDCGCIPVCVVAFKPALQVVGIVCIAELQMLGALRGVRAECKISEHS